MKPRHLWALLAGALVASVPAYGQTRADTLDARCVWYRLDSLTWANGVGQRRNLANAGKVCNAALLARKPSVRVDTVRVTRTDTILRLRVDTITLTRVDTVRVPADTVVTPPPPPTDTVVTPAFAKLLPLAAPTVAAVTALGGTFAQYEQDFVANDERLWAAAIAQTAQPLWEYQYLDYYDRVAIYYVRYQRTGDTKYRDRARRLAASYVSYVVANKGNVPWNEMMNLGVALYYADTQDAAAKQAVVWMAENCAFLITTDPYGYASTNTDDRILAYALRSVRLAYLLNLPSTGGNWGLFPDWSVVLAKGLDRIFAARDADGQWRHARAKDATGKVLWTAAHSFTIGLMHDELVQYYQTVAKDARILPALKTSADILWRDAWVAPGVVFTNPYTMQLERSVGAFKYVEKPGTTEGGDNPTADLNQLIVNGYAWLASVTGDTSYKTKARAIFDGGVLSGGVTGDGKHQNQQTSSSQRALYWISR